MTTATYSSVKDPNQKRSSSPTKQSRSKWNLLWLSILLVASLVGASALYQHYSNGNTKKNLAAASQDPRTSRSSQPLTAADQVKTKWPELVGQPAELAKATILTENTSLVQVQIIPQDSMVTMDYREDRVRIFVDENNKVASPPRVG